MTVGRGKVEEGSGAHRKVIKAVRLARQYCYLELPLARASLLGDSTFLEQLKSKLFVAEITSRFSSFLVFKGVNFNANMPALDSIDGPRPEPEPLTRLPFQPVKKSHILHCSYDYWHPK
jgi:hypothetical protein